MISTKLNGSLPARWFDAETATWFDETFEQDDKGRWLSIHTQRPHMGLRLFRTATGRYGLCAWRRQELETRNHYYVEKRNHHYLVTDAEAALWFYRNGTAIAEAPLPLRKLMEAMS